ncbi:MAG: hypothetical protein IPG44_13190 [Anaerolineales bacterium]|jgi:hypothetical protein|nr:hypothetical protein [Chloroflexota bacterium]MBK6646674.1 hypothetical protein [Anaerolineales bacterium]MCC6986828.1 hypothetical protein [Anaerolineales bacterium]
MMTFLIVVMIAFLLSEISMEWACFPRRKHHALGIYDPVLILALLAGFISAALGAG